MCFKLAHGLSRSVSTVVLEHGLPHGNRKLPQKVSLWEQGADEIGAKPRLQERVAFFVCLTLQSKRYFPILPKKHI